MFQPYDEKTASQEDRIAWVLCQIIDDDAPMRWTRYRFAAVCIARNAKLMADLQALGGLPAHMVTQRPLDQYPKRDLTPEHTQRGNDHDSDAPIHPQVAAAYAYVDSVADAADMAAGSAPAWHGWALREAFLAGCSHAAKTPA